MPRLATLALVALVWIGCAPAEERAEDARMAIRGAIERGDRAAAVGAVADLEEALGDSPEALLELAAARVAVGSSPEAFWGLEAALRRHPERDELRLALANTALLLSNPSRAREVLQPIEPESDSHAQALMLRAQAELKLGDLDAALEIFDEAEQRYPDQPQARLSRVNTLLRERRNDEARAAIEALQSDPDVSDELSRRLLLTLAQLRAQQGEAEEAIASLEAMIEEDPTDAAAWQALVQALRQHRGPAEALARVETALAGEDPLLGLHPVAAQIYTARGELPAAEAALRRYAELAESGAAYVPLVMHFSELDDIASAGEVLDEALGRFPDDTSLQLMRVETLLAAGRVDEARTELGRFRDATFDGDPQIDYLQARLDLAEGRIEEAKRTLRELAPRLDRGSTHYWLGIAHELSGDIEGARRRYGLAQRRDPSWPAPVAALISIAQQRQDWDEMATWSRRLVQQAPQRFESWSLLAEALGRKGEGAEAVRVAETARARFPDEPAAQLLLARALRAQGDFEAALSTMAELEATAALDAERVQTLGMAGRIAEAVAFGRERAAAHPESAALQVALASVLYAAGEAEAGARATDRALALAPDDFHPLRVRCEFRAATGRWAGAVEDCRRYLDRHSEDAPAHFMLGLAQASSGDADGGIASYRRAAELDPRDARPRNNLAELLAAQGDLDGALAQAQEAYRLAADDAMVIDTLGMLYLKKGLPDRAVALMERAREAAPGQPQVALNLALAYRDAGRSDDARSVLAELGQREEAPEALRVQAREVLHSLP